MKERKKIRTIVVCKESKKEFAEIKAGVFNYRIKIKELKGYKAEEVLDKEKPIRAELMFVPLMESELKISDRIRKAILRLKEIEKDERKIIDFTAAILVLSNRLISFEEFKSIWGEIKMLNIIRYAEEIGKEEGIKEGIKEGIELAISIKFGETGIMEKINGITDIEKLEKLKDEIRRAKTIEELANSI